MYPQKPTRSYSGLFFISLTVTAITVVYLDFMRVIYPQAIDPFDARRGNARIYLVAVNILLLLQLWAFLQVAFSDPGRVPAFWVRSTQGFAGTDSSTAKRRYCLMCHIFKPDRCHHCSVCNRCVLQMDHHCPWVNNCVGFYNRKFFVLLLWYTLLLLFTDLAAMWPRVTLAGKRLMVSTKQSGQYNLENAENLYSIGLYTFLCCLSIVLLNFFKFHLTLVLRNHTTIEHIERARTGQTANEFEKGLWGNWVQVFGTRVWMWGVPMYSSCGQPEGDGVNWIAPEAPATVGTPQTLASPQHLIISAKSTQSRPLPARAKSDVLETSMHPEESDLRGLTRLGNNQSGNLSQSFK